MSKNGDGFDPIEGAAEEAFKGAHLDLADFKREDGILTRGGASYQSLLHRVISAIKEDKEYRNELKTALWASSDEADNAVAALDECFELHMDPRPIIDQIIARSSGRNHELLAMALQTLTHTTFTTNYPNQRGKYVRPKGGNTSPLA